MNQEQEGQMILEYVQLQYPQGTTNGLKRVLEGFPIEISDSGRKQIVTVTEPERGIIELRPKTNSRNLTYKTTLPSTFSDNIDPHLSVRKNNGTGYELKCYIHPRK